LPARSWRRSHALRQVSWLRHFRWHFWVSATILGGYSLGRSVPNIGKYIHYVIAVVVLVSILPAVIGVLKAGRPRLRH